jgi:two-component system, OmpR family, response regulator
MHHAGRIVSRIVEHLYEQDFDRDSNTVEVFVGRLRKKLGVDVIKTMRGLGYLLSAPETAEAHAKPPGAATRRSLCCPVERWYAVLGSGETLC